MRTSLFLFLILCLAACSAPAPTPVLPVNDAAVARRNASFTETDCGGGGGGDNPFFRRERRCGTLTVPADRADPNSAEIELAVIIIPAEEEQKFSDPVLFLWYGPGPQTPFAMAFPFLFEELGQQRDFIIVDQRGVGRSTPAADCPALATIFYETLDLPFDDKSTQADLNAARQQCWAAWQSEGINVENYSTDELVEDLEDLRLELGLQEWNVAGVGYGAAVALQLASRYPSGVRAVAVDSLPPNSPAEYSGYAARREAMLERLFELCASDEKCDEAFPTLRDTFYAAVERLDADPQVLSIRDLDSGRRFDFYFDGGRLIDITIGMLQLNFLNTFPELPRMIVQVHAGNYERLQEMLGQAVQYFETPTSMVNWRYQCLEVLPLSAREEALRIDLTSPVSTHLRRELLTHFDSCAAWENTPAPAALPAPGGNTPLLALHGGLYTTERAWLESATVNFSDRQIVDITDGTSLAILGAPSTMCGTGLIEDFFADPEAELDTACAAQPLQTTWITFQ